MNKLTARQVIDILGLQPHPEEGGFFVETYRSEENLAHPPSRYDGKRAHSTAIYYLLTPETYSHMHRLESDEIFHFYAGDPCEMLQLHEDGTGETIHFGADLTAGQRPQIRVPRGSWQGMRLLPGGEFALMGCTVSPGFEFADYSHGTRDALCQKYPDYKMLITTLTTA